MPSVDTMEIRHLLELSRQEHGSMHGRVLKDLLAWLDKIEHDYDANMSKEQTTTPQPEACDDCKKTDVPLGNWGKFDDALLCQDCFIGRMSDQADRDYERYKESKWESD